MERTKGSSSKITSLRRELEKFVVSTNTVLRGHVRSMSLIILLRNCHPVYRLDFAYQLRDAGVLSASDLKEFLTPVAPMKKFKKYV
jgi:hypothetical protein